MNIFEEISKFQSDVTFPFFKNAGDKDILKHWILSLSPLIGKKGLTAMILSHVYTNTTTNNSPDNLATGIFYGSKSPHTLLFAKLQPPHVRVAVNSYTHLLSNSSVYGEIIEDLNTTLNMLWYICPFWNSPGKILRKIPPNYPFRPNYTPDQIQTIESDPSIFSYSLFPIKIKDTRP